MFVSQIFFINFIEFYKHVIKQVILWEDYPVVLYRNSIKKGGKLMKL